MIAYTFRTYPYIDQLKEIFDEVFVFGALKADYEAFSEKLLIERPEAIVGIADTKKPSRIEPITVNKFNKGTVSPDHTDELRLYVPPALTELIPLATQPTTTFCNWTMYKLQSYIQASDLDTKLSFLHINKQDIEQLRSLV